jgi:Domain of unknown function (DUF4194)
MQPELHASVMLRLLQGAVEFDDRGTWNDLIRYEKIVRQDFARIGLELVFAPSAGYAFLRQPELETEDGETIALPRLVSRHRLSRDVTLLCVLLRERLDQFENSTPDSDRLLVSQEDLRELQRPFAFDLGDERSLFKKFDKTIQDVVKLGFLRPINNAERFEVRQIIKARITAEQLLELKQTLLESAPQNSPEELEEDA